MRQAHGPPMRLILCHRHMSIRQPPPRLPEGTVVFTFFEDFSVGPIADWTERPAFDRQRAAFWRDVRALDLPDGSTAEYFVWYQALPRIDLVKAIESGLSFDDLPPIYDRDGLLDRAEIIEIWHDQSVAGLLFRWFTLADLQQAGVSRDRVRACVLPDEFRAPLADGTIAKMLLDQPDRPVPKRPVSPDDLDMALACWDARVRLPTPTAMLPGADALVARVFEILAARHPNPVTGLGNIETRLLASASQDWRKMARVVGEAMASGIDAGDPVGDGVLQHILHQMAQHSPPLVRIDGEGALRNCRVQLTEAGAAHRETSVT